MASNNTSAQVTTHDTDHHVHVAKTLSPLFVDDPPVRFILSSLSEEARLAYMDDYFGTLVKAAALNSAEFVEANDWDCTAVWLPPGKRIDNPWTWWSAGFVGCLWKLGVAGCKRMMIDYQSASDKCKHQALAGMESYHYLFLVGTKVSARGRGLASQIIRKKQAQATKEGLPIWLEATTERSRDVYKGCGFDVVGTFKLGEGHFASTGDKEDGGPGATIWAMLWKPEKDEDVM